MRLPEEIRCLFRPDEIFTFVAHDQTPVATVVLEPDCPRDQIHAVNGLILVPHVIARRLPEAEGVLTHAQGSVPCWKLSSLAVPPSN